MNSQERESEKIIGEMIAGEVHTFDKSHANNICDYALIESVSLVPSKITEK